MSASTSSLEFQVQGDVAFRITKPIDCDLIGSSRDGIKDHLALPAVGVVVKGH